MTNKLRTHLAYTWWLYAVSAVLIIVLWLSLFSKLAEPRAYEQIHMTYIGPSFDHVALENDLYDVLPQRTEQKIERISVENARIEGEYDLNTVLRARSAGDTDFFVIESSVIERYQMRLASFFPEADASALERAFGRVPQVTEENKVYGLACASDSKLARYYSGNGTCRIFFNKRSVNLSDLFGGKTEQDAALQIIRYLTEEQDV